MMRAGLSRIAIVAFALTQPLAAAHAQAPRPGPRAAGPVAADPELEVVQVAADVYMIGGAGGNITVNVGSNGLFVVDTGTQAASAKVVAAIRAISDKPIRYITDTSADADHVGGNIAVKGIGQGIRTRENREEGAVIVAHEAILTRMSAPTGQQAPFPQAALPTDTYFTKKKDLFFNGEAIEILHEPSAHTDGDSIVFFRRSDVVSAGDVFVTTTYPVIDLDRGGNIRGVLGALNHILDITVPREKQEGGTYVVPGHGRLSDEADVLEYRDMLTIVRDRIQDLVTNGMTLEQVKAARPTLDYDGRYGAATGFWTTDKFIEAVYRNLSAERTKSR